MNYTGLVKFGDKGAAVLWVQQRLVAHGINLRSASGGPALDGQFGSGTRAAVYEFQRKKGLLADGIVGPQTWSALASAPVTVEPPANDSNSTGGKSDSKPVTGWIEAEKENGSSLPMPLILAGLGLAVLIGLDNEPPKRRRRRRRR